MVKSGWKTHWILDRQADRADQSALYHQTPFLLLPTYLPTHSMHKFIVNNFQILHGFFFAFPLCKKKKSKVVVVVSN